MSVTISGNLDDFFDNVLKHASDEMHEHFAKGVAERARESGMTSADNVDIHASSDSSEMPIDIERVRRRANQLLGVTPSLD